jgi:NAD+ kinase
MVLRLKIDGRGKYILVTLDSRSVVMESSFELKICKAPYKIKTLRLSDHDFYNTLRSKLMWGVDKRN